MPGAIYRYLSEDHDRIDALLERAVGKPSAIDTEPYSEFRKGLLRHIAMEEKILFPAIEKWRPGENTALVKRLHIDHGVIVSLLAPPPTPSIILTIRAILAAHNPLEEGEGGLYGLFEEMAGPEMESMLAQLKATPAVPVLPNNAKPEVLEAAKSAVAAAGYEFKSSP